MCYYGQVRQVAKSLLSIDFTFVYNMFRHIRNKCVSSLFGGRVFIDNAERLLFSYQSVQAEARIYTRQFGWKCEFVCKN